MIDNKMLRKIRANKFIFFINDTTIYNCFILVSLITFLLVADIFPNQLDGNINVVEKYGQLKVEGNKIVDKNGSPVVLRGMSFFWSQWIGKYYNYDCIKWLRDDWKCTVVRAAMAVESGGYLTNPLAEMTKIKTVIDACIDLGIYVIVDWHDHNAQNHRTQAIEFFNEIADQYGDQPNIIYEIFNEPLNTVTWANDVKPYADSVVSNIRSIDPDNIILVGSPTWSQDVDIASKNPIKFNNIAYTLHYYAATHKQWLRNKATIALNNGAALFVSEFGTCSSDGNGAIDYTETENWFSFLEKNKISWCNWSIADKNETSAALISGADQNGGWSESDLSESGNLIRNRIVTWNDSVFTSVRNDKNLSDLPSVFRLQQNYPNPFNPETKIDYELSSNGQVKLEVYDATGRKIKSLHNGNQIKGHYSITWDGTTDSGIRAASGVYFFHFIFYQNDGFSESQRRVLKGILLN